MSCFQNFAANAAKRKSYKTLSSVMVRWKIYSCVAWIETSQYSCVSATHKSPTNSSNLEYSKRRTTRRSMIWNLNLQNDLSSPWPTCWSSPHPPHTSWHIYICQIFESQNVDCQIFNAYLYGNTDFNTMKPCKFWSKFPANTLFDALRCLDFFNFSLRQPRGATRHYRDLSQSSLFLFPVPTRHHWKNKFILVAVPSVLTG